MFYNSFANTRTFYFFKKVDTTTFGQVHLKVDTNSCSGYSHYEIPMVGLFMLSHNKLPLIVTIQSVVLRMIQYNKNY